MARPKVFVSRRIPDEGLNAIAAACEVDLWPDRLPPPADELKRRVQGCDGLVSLLTDRIDSTLGTGGSNLDIPGINPIKNYNIIQADVTWRF